MRRFICCAVVLIGVVAPAYACSNAPDLPGYARPHADERFEKVAEGTYFNGQTDQHYWLYTGDHSVLELTRAIRGRLQDEGWSAGELGIHSDPAAFIADRDRACFLYGDFETKLPGYIDVLKREAPGAANAALSSPFSMYIVTGCS